MGAVTVEFKREAVQLANDSAQSLAHAARERGIRHEMLRTWKRQAQSRAGLTGTNGFPGNGKLTSDQEEIPSQRNCREGGLYSSTPQRVPDFTDGLGFLGYHGQATMLLTSEQPSSHQLMSSVCVSTFVPFFEPATSAMEAHGTIKSCKPKASVVVESVWSA